MITEFGISRKGRVALVMLLAAVAASVAPASRAASQTASVPFRSQQASSWCWAAASQMVLEHLHAAGDLTQPCQAELAIPTCRKAPRNTCGNVTPVFLDCDSPGFPSFGLFGYTAETLPSPQSWPQLKTELDACRPVLFGWCLPGLCGSTAATSKGHWMVAAAADVCQRPGGDAVPIVKVFNPAPCCNGRALWIPFSFYESGGEKLDFWQNHYRVRPKDQPPPQDESVACRLTAEVAQPQANFETNGDPATLVRQVLASCLGTPERWLSSQLLRPPLDVGSLQGELNIAGRVRRHLVSLALFAGLQANRSQLESMLAFTGLPQLWVFPVRAGSQAVANVVLEEWPPGRYRLQVIEDSEAARLLLARMAAVPGRSGVSPVEFVLVEIGLPVLYEGEVAVVVFSESTCRKPKPDEAEVRSMHLQELFGFLQPLAAPYAER